MKKFTIIGLCVIICFIFVGQLILNSSCDSSGFARGERTLIEPKNSCTELSMENTGETTIIIYGTEVYEEGDAMVFGEKKEGQEYEVMPSSKLKIVIDNTSEDRMAFQVQGTDESDISFSYSFR